jgi:hypothetical protein
LQRGFYTTAGGQKPGSPAIINGSSAAKINNALRQNDYQTAFKQMEEAKKQITANPEAYSKEVAGLRDKIKNAKVSGKLTVGNKMSKVVADDIAKWESEIDHLTTAMTGQIDEVMKDMSAKIPAAQNLYKSSPKEKIEELTTEAVKKGTTPDKQDDLVNAAVRKEMEIVAPPSTVVQKPEVQQSANDIEALVDRLKDTGLDGSAVQKVMGDIHTEISRLSAALQGEKKVSDDFVKSVTAPLAHQAHGGSMGQFGVNSEEWKKFMYNMEHLYKFFRDKAPKKSGGPGSKESDMSEPSSPADSAAA